MKLKLNKTSPTFQCEPTFVPERWHSLAGVVVLLHPTDHSAICGPDFTWTSVRQCIYKYEGESLNSPTYLCFSSSLGSSKPNSLLRYLRFIEAASVYVSPKVSLTVLHYHRKLIQSWPIWRSTCTSARKQTAIHLSVDTRDSDITCYSSSWFNLMHFIPNDTNRFLHLVYRRVRQGKRLGLRPQRSISTLSRPSTKASWNRQALTREMN